MMGLTECPYMSGGCKAMGQMGDQACTRHRALRGEDVSALQGQLCGDCRRESERMHNNSRRKHRAVWVGKPCAGCGNPATGTDHIVPFSLGGSDEPDNLQPLCSRCNSVKAATLTGVRVPKPPPTVHFIYADDGRGVCSVPLPNPARGALDAADVTCKRCIAWMRR